MVKSYNFALKSNKSEYFLEQVLLSQNFIFPLWSIYQSSMLVTNTGVIYGTLSTNQCKN